MAGILEKIGKREMKEEDKLYLNIIITFKIFILISLSKN